MEDINQNPINPLVRWVKDSKKQGENKISLDENKYVKNPYTLVPFENCIRVQKDYFIEYKNELVCVNKDIINTDYGRDAANKVRKYLKFVNCPEHINYRKEIDLNYNLYRPLPHYPEKGNFPNIEKILSHIFRGENYEMILTYFWVLYMQPKHPLPFIGLVSKIKGTGKTIFLGLVKGIFALNAKFIDAEDISANFNSSFMDKLCILIDEKIDGKNRKSDLQKYKKLVTGGFQTRKEKYQNDVDVEFFAKFAMCGNDTETMLALEEENTRFWIIDVEKLEDEDVDILPKAIKEIPAFLFYLQHEYKPMERKSRLWFSVQDIQSDRSRVFQENSRSEVSKEITERLIDYFTEHISYSEVTFSATHFLDSFSIRNVSINYLGRVLTSEMGREKKEANISNPFNNYNNQPSRCRSYTFTRDEIMGSGTDRKEVTPPKRDDTVYYDPDWVDGEFD